MNFNEHKKRQNNAIVDVLMAQKKQNDVLIDAMEERIKFLEDELEQKNDARFCRYKFFTENHPELIPEYVAVVYAQSDVKANARTEVSSFHDETLDLSTLECTGTDFKRWEKNGDENNHEWLGCFRATT